MFPPSRAVKCGVDKRLKFEKASRQGDTGSLSRNHLHLQRDGSQSSATLSFAENAELHGKLNYPRSTESL
jgi:hypothetical protein